MEVGSGSSWLNGWLSTWCSGRVGGPLGVDEHGSQNAAVDDLCALSLGQHQVEDDEGLDGVVEGEPIQDAGRATGRGRK